MKWSRQLNIETLFTNLAKRHKVFSYLEKFYVALTVSLVKYFRLFLGILEVVNHGASRINWLRVLHYKIQVVGVIDDGGILTCPELRVVFLRSCVDLSHLTVIWFFEVIFLHVCL